MPIGPLAHRLWNAPRFRARVIAAGLRAIYLRDQDGEVTWFGAAGTATHRRAVIVDVLPRLSAGAELELHDGVLVSAGQPILSLRGARILSDGEPPAGHAVSLIEAATKLRALAGFDAVRMAPSPLLRIVRRFLYGAPGAAPDDSFTAAALPALAAAVASMRRGDVDVAVDAMLRLVGLGPGLTPSGDDAAGAFLFALRRGAAVWPLQQPSAGLDTARLASLRSETHEISWAILSDLALGHAPEPLARLAREVEGSRAGPQLETVRRLLAIGSHSGADMLAGYLAGMAGAHPANARGCSVELTCATGGPRG